MTRMHRKREHTPEDKARLQAIRDHFQTARPLLEELVASGEYSEPVQPGVTLDAMHIASLLKHAREEAHLSLADVAVSTVPRLAGWKMVCTRTLPSIHCIA